MFWPSEPILSFEHNLCWHIVAMSTADLARDIGSWLSDHARMRAELAQLRHDHDHWRSMAIESREMVRQLRTQDARMAMVNINGRTDDMKTVLYVHADVEDVFIIKKKLANLYLIRRIMTVSWWQLRIFHDGDELRDTTFLRGRRGILGTYQFGLYVEVDRTLTEPCNVYLGNRRPRYRSRSRSPPLPRGPAPQQNPVYALPATTETED